MGLHIVMFAKKTIASKMSNIAVSQVKLGMQGKAGNKGSVIMRFKY